MPIASEKLLNKGEKQQARQNMVERICLDFVRILRISPLRGCIQQNFEGLDISKNVGRKKVPENRCNAKNSNFDMNFFI